MSSFLIRLKYTKKESAFFNALLKKILQKNLKKRQMGVDKENFYDIMAVRRTKNACVTSIPQAARRPCTAFASEKESYYENRFKVVASYRC